MWATVTQYWYMPPWMNKTTQSGKFSQSLNNTLTNGVFIIWTELNPDFDA